MGESNAEKHYEADCTLEEIRHTRFADADYSEFDPPSKEVEFEYERLMTFYRSAIKEIETKFDILNDYYAFAFKRNPISIITSRLKSQESLMDKLKRRNLPPTIASIEENIFDVAGIRIVCNFPEDVYTVAETFLNQDDVQLVNRKDYIANPKENGYRSLHLIVAIPIFLTDRKKIMHAEIQIRTIAMEFWASLEHDIRYKKDFEFTPKMRRELAACAELSAMLDERMDLLRQKVL